MRLTTFASGSGGNCALLSCGDTHILLDAGISMKRIRTGLAGQGLSPGQLSAVLITHAHTDHIAGLRVLCRQAPVSIYASGETAAQIRRALPEVSPWLYALEDEVSLCLDGVEVRSFPTLHDTPGSRGYVISDGRCRFGLCTDLGCVTDDVHDALMGVDAAILEANHDVAMLWNGPYPYPLKQRIVSPRGHLSNEQCGALAAQLAEQGACTIILGHISKENNLPGLALKTVRRFLPEAFPLIAAPAEEAMTVIFGESICLE